MRVISGLYEARTWLHGEPVGGAIGCHVHPAPLSAAHCTASGAIHLAEAGVTARMWIEARDRCGNLVGKGGEMWRVWFEPRPLELEEAVGLQAERAEEAEKLAMTAASAQVEAAAAEATVGTSVRDCGDGRYCITYCVKMAARYKLHLVRGFAPADEALGGSPFELLVEPSPSDPWSTTVTRGWERCVAGVTTVVRLNVGEFRDEDRFRRHGK